MKLHFDKNDIEDIREVNSPDFWNGQICDDWLAMHAEVERLRDEKGIVETQRDAARQRDNVQLVSSLESELERLQEFADKFCPRCDGCSTLLLSGGVMLADGITQKPCRVVCPECSLKNKAVEAEGGKSETESHQNCGRGISGGV